MTDQEGAPNKPKYPKQPPKAVVSMAHSVKRKGRYKLSDLANIKGPEALWPGYLYRGTYTLLSGDAGVGKTAICCDMIARASRGGPFPRSEETFTPVRSLILATEDSAGTFRERLEACGADLTLVDILRPEEDEPPIPLGELHHELPGFGLVFIETLEAHMPSVGHSNDNAVVRQGLQPFLRALEYHQCVGLTVRHWNKGAGQKLIYRSSGAVAYTAASRTALAVSVDGARNRFLTVVKCNLAREQPPLRFSLPPDLKPVWEGYDGGSTAGLPPEVADAVEMLRRLLADGHVPSRAVLGAARAASVPAGVLNAAKVHLGIVPRHVGFGRGSFWEWGLPLAAEEGPPVVDLRTLGEEPSEWGSDD